MINKNTIVIYYVKDNEEQYEIKRDVCIVRTGSGVTIYDLTEEDFNNTIKLLKEKRENKMATKEEELVQKIMDEFEEENLTDGERREELIKVLRDYREEAEKKEQRVNLRREASYRVQIEKQSK